MLNAGRQPLHWIRRSRFARGYELRDADGGVHATLDFAQLVGRAAVAEANGRRWTLATEGWLRPLVRIESPLPGANSGTVQMYVCGWAGRGTVTLDDGQQFRWGPTHLWSDRVWAFTSAADGHDVVFCKKPFLRQTSNVDLLVADLTIASAAPSGTAVETLAILAGYLFG